MKDLSRVINTLRQSRLINRVEESIERWIGAEGLKKKETKILVGFSGGKDSTFLLLALYSLKERLNLKLFAGHLNHLIRGEEAERDEKFCRAFCRELKIPLVVKRSDVKRYAKKKRISLEEAGRIIRYRFLEKIRKEKGLDFIALGHNATDNCETMILSLVGGKGPSGIGGIPERRDRIIRPLIDIKGEEIFDLLKKNDIPYVFDTTNLSLSHPRNYIRHIILPFLRGLNPNLEETMRQTARILQEEDAYLKTIVAKLKKSGIKKTAGGYLIDRKTFLSYNLSVRRRLIKELFSGMSYEDVERVIMLSGKPSGKEVSLKDGLRAISEPEGIFIGRLGDKRTSNSNRELKVGFLNRIDDMGLELLLLVRNQWTALDMGKDREYFDWDALSPPLSIRHWQAGDFLIYEQGKKKLQDLFVDYKIPKRLKTQIPILVDQKGILWVLGLRRAARAMISEKTKKVLEVRIKRWKENPTRKI